VFVRGWAARKHIGIRLVWGPTGRYPAQPAMVPGGSQLSGTLPATWVPVSVTVPP
jgi:hypothetical protein